MVQSCCRRCRRPLGVRTAQSQWVEGGREVSGKSREHIEAIRRFAGPRRVHGSVSETTADLRLLFGRNTGRHAEEERDERTGVNVSPRAARRCGSCRRFADAAVVRSLARRTPTHCLCPRIPSNLSDHVTAP
ncbi:hypothetical protein F2P81_023649 [Scophthalmus maximus]|uniref:Uncharacterized protein n=1 Tax=Scophthalmus maximus TaxID=52904 RepID=A0A6A4RWN6_SCOMX|nr:hypothetical protein F2P81_023649 [Scophthalmus maximus]